MTSMPASRRARAMILAPRSWPSSPTFATTTLIVRSISPILTARVRRARDGRPHERLGPCWRRREGREAMRARKRPPLPGTPTREERQGGKGCALGLGDGRYSAARDPTPTTGGLRVEPHRASVADLGDRLRSRGNRGSQGLRGIRTARPFRPRGARVRAGLLLLGPEPQVPSAWGRV